MRELSELRTSPPDGIRVVVNEDNMLDVTGIVEGPGKPVLERFAILYTPLTRRIALLQRARRMRVATLGLGSTSRKSSPLPRQNVRISYRAMLTSPL